MVDSQCTGEISISATESAIPANARTVPHAGGADSPLPSADDLLIGAMLYGDRRGVLAFVHDTDTASPAAAAVLGAIRSLTGRGADVSPPIVLDELVRQGAPRAAREALRCSVTAGAAIDAAPEYAAAVVAAAFRRLVESYGLALKTAAEQAPEREMCDLVIRCGNVCGAMAARLAHLRGGMS